MRATTTTTPLGDKDAAASRADLKQAQLVCGSIQHSVRRFTETWKIYRSSSTLSAVDHQHAGEQRGAAVST